MGEDRSVLQMGGLSGLLAGIIILIAFVPFSFTLPTDPSQGAFLVRIREARVAFLLAASLLLIGFLLSSGLSLALYRSLRTEAPSRALVGGVFGVAGALLWAIVWSMGLITIPFLSDLYAGVQAADLPIVVRIADLNQQLSHSFQLLGGLLIGLGFASFGLAQLGGAGHSRGYGGASVVLGSLVVVSIIVGVAPVEVAMAFAGIALFAMIALFLLFGWKFYRQSRTA